MVSDVPGEAVDWKQQGETEIKPREVLRLRFDGFLYSREAGGNCRNFPALPVGAVFGVTRAAFFRGYRGKGFRGYPLLFFSRLPGVLNIDVMDFISSKWDDLPVGIAWHRMRMQRYESTDSPALVGSKNPEISIAFYFRFFGLSTWVLNWGKLLTSSQNPSKLCALCAFVCIWEHHNPGNGMGLERGIYFLSFWNATGKMFDPLLYPILGQKIRWFWNQLHPPGAVGAVRDGIADAADLWGVLLSERCSSSARALRGPVFPRILDSVNSVWGLLGGRRYEIDHRFLSIKIVICPGWKMLDKRERWFWMILTQILGFLGSRNFCWDSNGWLWVFRHFKVIETWSTVMETKKHRPQIPQNSWQQNSVFCWIRHFRIWCLATLAMAESSLERFQVLFLGKRPILEDWRIQLDPLRFSCWAWLQNPVDVRLGQERNKDLEKMTHGSLLSDHGADMQHPKSCLLYMQSSLIRTQDLKKHNSCKNSSHVPWSSSRRRLRASALPRLGQCGFVSEKVKKGCEGSRWLFWCIWCILSNYSVYGVLWCRKRLLLVFF